MSADIASQETLLEPAGYDHPEVGPVTQLIDGLDLNELIENGTTFEVHPDDLYDEALRENTFGEEILGGTHYTDLLDSDEDSDSDLSPFEKLAKKMDNVDPNGYVKKRLLQAGNGQRIPDNASVTVHYDGFLEYGDEPYDSTMNKYPRTYRLGAGMLIPGLELAILSMEDREVSQFLIQPNYAFGRLGCPDRIPPDATIMFRIEIIRFVDSLTADKFEKLSKEDLKKFTNVRKYAETHQTKAKEYFRSKNYKAAIKSYNTAVNLLETAQLANMAEQEVQQNTLLKLYTNLAVCYNLKELPRKACLAIQRVYNLTADRKLKVPVKAYFHHAKALIQLSEYGHAKAKLLKAKSLEPNNPEIMTALAKVEKLICDYKSKELKLAQAMTENQQAEILDISDVDPAFVSRSKQFVKDFKDSDSLVQELPDGLTGKELKLMQMEAEAEGLEFSNYQNNGKYIYTILKTT